MNGSFGVLQDAYNYCNMAHVGSAGFATYPLPPSNLSLHYVEIVQRHHKRTPYASNTFPHEDIPWSCDDVKLVSYAIPDNTEVSSVYVSRQCRLSIVK
jgi:2-phosphoxylose phosphatase